MDTAQRFSTLIRSGVIPEAESLDLNELFDKDGKVAHFNDKRFLVVTVEELDSLQKNAFFQALPKSDLDLIAHYLPEDIDQPIMLKYIDLVMLDDEVDDYNKCRFIQQLIDWDRYLQDMFAALDDGYTVLSSRKVIAVESAEAPYLAYVLPLEQSPNAQLLESIGDNGNGWGLTHLYLVQDDFVEAYQPKIAQKFQTIEADTPTDLINALKQRVEDTTTKFKSLLFTALTEEVPYSTSFLILSSDDSEHDVKFQEESNVA